MANLRLSFWSEKAVREFQKFLLSKGAMCKTFVMKISHICMRIKFIVISSGLLITHENLHKIF